MNSSVFRFIVTGVLSNLVALAIGNALFWLFGSAAFGAAIGYAVGLVNSFLLGKYWVFEEQNAGAGMTIREIWRFTLVYATSGVTLTALCYLLVDILGFIYALSYIGAGVIAATMNYLGSRYLVFGNASGQSTEPA